MTLYATLPDLYEVINKAADRIQCNDLVAAMQQNLFTKDEKDTIEQYAHDIMSLGINKLYQDDGFAGIFAQRVNLQPTYSLRSAMASNFTGHGLEVKMNIYYNPFSLCYNEGIRSLGTSFVRTDKNGKARKLKFDEPNDFYVIAASILHECLHLINDHQHEFAYYNEQGLSELVNIACDGAINQVDYIANNSVLANYVVTFKSLCELVGDKVTIKPKDTAMNYFKALYQANQEDIKNAQDFLQGLKDAQSSGSSQGGDSSNGTQADQQQQNKPASGQKQNSSQQQQDDSKSDKKQNSDQQQNQSASDKKQDSSQQQQNQSNSNKQQDSNSEPNLNGKSEAYKAGYKLGQSSLNPQLSHSTWQNNPSDVDDVKDDTSLTQDDINAVLLPTIKNAMEKSHTDPESLKSRGLISEGIADQLIAGSATTEHRIPLRSIIMRGAGRLKFQNKSTYSRINHQQSNRIDIRRGHRKLNNKNLHVFVDCSGSMSDDDISWALKEIAYVAKRIKAEITIIPFDADVYPDQAQKIDKHGNYEFEPIGRGGTVVQPCFDYLHDTGAVSNNSDLAIFLTDGGLEDHVNSYGLRNIVWILVNSNEDTLSIRDYDGYVAYLDQDQDYLFHKMSER